MPVLAHSPGCAITWVIHGPWTEDIEAHSGPRVDVVDEALEELSPVILTVTDGVISLAAKDGQKLGTGLEEAAPFADRLELAVEPGRSGAVAVTQEATMLGSDPSHVGTFDAGRKRLPGLVTCFDGLGHPEVLLGHGPI